MKVEFICPDLLEMFQLTPSEHQKLAKRIKTKFLMKIEAINSVIKLFHHKMIGFPNDRNKDVITILFHFAKASEDFRRQNDLSFQIS